MTSPSEIFSSVLIGGESLLIQCGEILLSRGHGIAAVVSRDAQILGWAESKGIATARPGRELASALGRIEFDYLLSITNLALLHEDVLRLARKGNVNFHDGPLPRYAGMYAPAWAIANGESEYGITFHEMTAEADEGDILVQRTFPIEPDDTSLTLNTRCYEAAIDAFSELVDALESAAPRRAPQDLSLRSYFPRHQRPDALAILDLARPADELVRLVRATQFGRYDNDFTQAKLAHDGKLVVVGAAQQEDGSGAAGEILALDDAGMVIASGSGAVRLADFQTPLGASVTAAEVAASFGVAVGSQLRGPDRDERARISAIGQQTTPAEAHWLRRLRTLDPVELPLERAERSDAQGTASGRVDVALPARYQDAFGDRAGLGIASAFAAYLSRLCGRIAVDVAFADQAWDERIAGLEALFARHVPIRVQFAPDATGSDAVSAIAVSPLVERGGFALDAIARHPDLAGDASLAAGRIAPVEIALHADADSFQAAPGTDFALVIAPDGARARVHYDTSAFTASAVHRIAEQFALFLDGLAAPDAMLATTALLGDADRELVLRTWNDTAIPAAARCVHDLISEQARRTPDAVALVFEGESLSYRELDERSNRLARHLQSQGVGPDALVGLYLDRSLEMVVGVLGVLKAGGAYVPLDPTYPSDRIEYMIEDSKARVILLQERLLDSLPQCAAEIVAIDRDWDAIAEHDAGEVASDATPDHLAYVIYTSGSTGKPKGVMVEHRNVANFFVGMDERVSHDGGGTWLAVTSLSFDISVLELLYTLARGFEVVVYADRERAANEPALRAPWRKMAFGLAMWGSDAGPGPAKYELMLESARFADRHGFSSFHTPERHFGAFGGPYPNPSVTSAAIAAVTENVKIRASSCVLPLHHPIRVAEEWAVVDNLSNGRVEMSFATGWQPNDFVIRPGGHGQSSDKRFEDIETVERLWRGEAVEFENPMGKMVPTTTLPRPVQKDLPIWITSASNIKTFEEAGAHGYNLLTHLLGQNLAEVTEKIAAYRRAREAHGHDPAAGTVTLMLHTYVGEDNDVVRELVREPMKDYLASAMSLVVGFAWSFPAFQRPGGPDQKPEDVDLASLTEEETDTILEFAFERYYETSGLFGTPEMCLDMVDRVRAAGVDEICCLIDFGVDKEQVLSGLELLADVQQRANTAPQGHDGETVGDFSFAAQTQAHAVTHLQCTPSMAQMLATNPDTRGSLARVSHLMIGGEAFPTALAKELDGLASGTVTNMYGPTETTIWSSTQRIEGSPDRISIGKPIANTRFYVLDRNQQPLPIGVPGELWIGGDGVVRGYHERPELTAERFIADPFSDTPGARMYRTGDLARWNEDGTIDFLGRLDHQVKIRGYRIELGEIEARLSATPGVKAAVVIAREDTPGDQRLVAYLTRSAGAVDASSLRRSLRRELPEFMVPSAFVVLDAFPHTPNGKIDRKALPAPDAAAPRQAAEFVAPESELEATIAGVWKQVLAIESIGIDDNFFDLGGHSLLVVQAHRKLREATPIQVSLTDLYRFPTVRGLAGYLGADATPGAAVKESQARGERRRQAAGRRRRGKRS